MSAITAEGLTGAEPAFRGHFIMLTAGVIALAAIILAMSGSNEGASRISYDHTNPDDPQCDHNLFGDAKEYIQQLENKITMQEQWLDNLLKRGPAVGQNPAEFWADIDEREELLNNDKIELERVQQKYGHCQ